MVDHALWDVSTFGSVAKLAVDMPSSSTSRRIPTCCLILRQSMSYAVALENLYALGQELVVRPGQPRRKFDLEQMRVLTRALGSPEARFRSVLIAGTNGKGSVAATLAGIFQAGGYRVGLYTSPHLTRPNERMRVAGPSVGVENPVVGVKHPGAGVRNSDISDDDFARLYFHVDEVASAQVRASKLPSHPSFFEVITAVGFCWFAERQVDLAVLEVGLGGRLDATNIVEPMLSIITDIALDHQEWLGDTIREIAREKAGILRRNGILVTLSQHPDANTAIGEIAADLNVRGVNAAEFMPPFDAPAWGAKWQQSMMGETVEIAPPLPGMHQHRNLALALAAAAEICNSYGYKLTAEQVSRGVRETRWPGRLERFLLPDREIEFWVDVAHNPAGAWALRAALSALDKESALGNEENSRTRADSPSTLVFGCLSDKPIAEMAQILFPMFSRIILTPVDSPRAASLEAMHQAGAHVAERLEVAPDLRQALALAMEGAGPRRVVLCGSLYLAGAARMSLINEFGGRPA